jgi:hypothetical protein
MFGDYIRHGWALCAIDRGNKAPTYSKWNRKPIDADTAEGIDGAGLLHVQSGTCALDIDDLGKARLWLAERGVDVDALLSAKDAVRISSGRVGRAKLLYRLKTPLRTIKPPGSGVELRCATTQGESVQDVLPPTVHPNTGKPYEWVYGEPLLGDWSQLPAIPASLKAAWRALIQEAPPEQPKANGHDVGLDKLQRWIDRLDPNCHYDEWVKIGMKLHDATGGAEEGLAIWDYWSSKATRLKEGSPIYRGRETCRVHWVSFSSPPGKIIAKVDNELPADADEFDIVTDAPKAEATTETKLRDTARKQRRDAIAKLESRLVYVVASEKYFDCERHRLINSEAALQHMFTSMMPMGRNGGRLDPVKVLKQSSTKRLVEGLGFHPGEGALFKVGDDTYANNYRNRLPQPLEPTELELRKIEWLFDRITDPTYRWWLKQFYAHVVQRPAIKIKSAPLLWSEEQRNGKSTLVKAIPALLVGPEYSEDVNHDLLNSSFNDYLQNAWHINLIEFRAGTRNERNMVYNKLKAYIADDTVAVHPKGSRGYTMPNHAFVTASSNHEDAATIDNNDERWGVHEFKQPRFTDAERQWIYHEFLLQPRAAAVLRHYFMHIDLTGFQAAGSAPMTKSKAEMAATAIAPDIETLQVMFEERSDFFARDVVIVREVTEHLHRLRIFSSDTRVGRILAKPPFNGVAKRFRDGDKLYRGVIVRNHIRWDSAAHAEVMEHLKGGNDDIDILS